jgi:hypothetical protein
MNQERFDELTRGLAASRLSRRQLYAGEFTYPGANLYPGS